MANWCSNCFSYYGPDENKVNALFKRLSKKEIKTNKGQTYKWFKDDRYLFEIHPEEGYVNFETKWCPSEDTIINIFKRYNISGTYEYEETGCGVYGKIYKHDGQISQVNLDPGDFNKYEYDELLDCYTYDNQEWDSESELLDHLLEQKIELKVIT